MSKETAVIAGAGPAGLTAALELARRSDIHPVVCEQSADIGGLSRTVNYHGNRIDIGGHRFFSKSGRVNQLWRELMPLQSRPAHDDILLNRDVTLSTVGADPETEDRVMLSRDRVSRIYYNGRFFDYPISLSRSTLSNLGLWTTLRVGAGYVAARLNRREEHSLEDLYINRFGRPLYSVFFEAYTEKVWGIHPSQLGADWGSQRVKGLSVSAILKNSLTKKFSRNKDNSHVETSLIESFLYPKYGPGQLWETAASQVRNSGGEVLTETKVKHVNVKDGRVQSVTIQDAAGERDIECDRFFSSMPLSELIEAIRGVDIPDNVKRVAHELPYRDFITVGLLVDKLKIKNTTKIKTYGDRIPDTWIYIQDRGVKVGRLQVFNNWSPYMVRDYADSVWIGLEYFTDKGDELWLMSDSEFIDKAVVELERIGVVDRKDVRDAVRIKVEKAYPAYHGAYSEIGVVREFLDTIENIYCIGRNGQHRYNNMDHSMMTSMKAVDAILNGSTDKTQIWNVNTETDYHESRS
jgi:protoporphyrinogen oxidase